MIRCEIIIIIKLEIQSQILSSLKRKRECFSLFVPGFCYVPTRTCLGVSARSGLQHFTVPDRISTLCDLFRTRKAQKRPWNVQKRSGTLDVQESLVTARNDNWFDISRCATAHLRHLYHWFKMNISIINFLQSVSLVLKLVT